MPQPPPQYILPPTMNGDAVRSGAGEATAANDIDIDSTPSDGNIPGEGEGGDTSEIRIGHTGNPVGSIGFMPDPSLLVGNGEGEQLVDETAEASKPLHTDDASDATDASTDDGSPSLASHFPLEISTEDGGVSALLPSGRVLVQRVGPLAPTNKACKENQSANETLDKEGAEKLGHAKSKSELAMEESKVREAIASEGDALEGEARYSYTPPDAGSPTCDAREAPATDGGPGSHPPLELGLGQSSGSEEPGQSSSGEEGGAPDLSLTHGQTTSSSISEDPTFNSYAQSDLSSMMSHLEIQHLLQQGRQQQHDMMAMGLGAGEEGQSPPLPDVIQGGKVNGKIGGRGRDIFRGERKTPTMVLYANQSLHRGGVNPTSIEEASPILRHVPRKKFPGNDHYQAVESMPSMSSHNLHRADAMDDASLTYEAPPPQMATPQERGQERCYPHLITQNSTMTMSTIGTAQTSPLQRQVNNYVHGGNRAAHPHPSHPPSRPVGAADGDDEETFHEIQNAAPLGCASFPSAAEGTTITVEVEVGSDDQTSSHSLETYRTTSTGQTSALSLLGTSTKSLADDLVGHDDEEEEGLERKETAVAHDIDRKRREHAADRSESEPGTASSAAALDWNNIQQPMPEPDRPSLQADDGYSADRSSYTLEANGIEECSTANSYGLELGRTLPMAGESESYGEEDSRQQGFGYGHAYNQDPLPPMEYAKPVVPPTFPSLMDSSVSSAMTASTAPSMAHSVGLKRPNYGEGEEREDSLPHIAQDHTVRKGSETNNAPQSAGVVHDPLAATTAAMPPAPLMMHAPASSGGMSDPRLNVEYERHYIVDLETLQEESSDGHELSSHGRQPSSGGGGTSSASTPKDAARAPAAAPTNNAGTAAMADFKAGGYAQLLQQQPVTEFYDYRHQYYTEQYHYCDDRFAHAPKGEEDDDATDSTCSSVTLSQAFHRDADSCSSSITDEYSESQPTPSLVSTVSSVTLSRALSSDRHDHSGQGFYVATRLGDFVEVPNDEEEGEGHTPGGIETSHEDGEDVSVLDSFDGESQSGAATTDFKSDGGTDTGMDAFSDAAAAGSKGAATPGAAQIAAHADSDIATDILAAIVPECGVPVPSVMAKVGASGRVRSSKGGMLLPWHSTRSIQNYHQGRRGKKKGASASRSMYSIGSVHTFRG